MCFAETAEFGRRKSIEAKCIQEDFIEHVNGTDLLGGG
jgi:hypothetical protein